MFSPEEHYRRAQQAREKQQPTVAYIFMKFSAEEGYPPAQFALSKMYFHGRGVEQDRAEALKWLKNAAERQHPDAQLVLGSMHLLGKVIERDPGRALKWFRSAAENGQPDAQFILGNLYSNGRLVPENPEKAREWYRRSAEQGHPGAQFTMGQLHERDGNATAALHWFGRAARGGFGMAQLKMVQLYSEGKLVERDPVKAYRWARIATGSSIEGIRRMATIMEKQIWQNMSRVQKREAKRSLKEWQNDKSRS